MKKSKCLLSILLVLVCCVTIFVGCSSELPEDGFVGDDGDKGQIVTDAVNRKLVYYVSMTVKVANVDGKVASVTHSAKDLGGYVERQYTTGDGNGNDDTRLTLRIPTEKLDEFLDDISGDCKILRKNISIADITTEYVDATAKLTSLQNRRQMLADLLNTEGISASDKIVIIKEIADVDAQIQSVQLHVNSYDSQVNFSSVTLYIDSDKVDAGPVVGVIVGIITAVGLFAVAPAMIILFVREKRKNRALIQNQNKQ